MKKRGFILIVIVGLLGAMAMIGMGFSVAANQEKKLSNNHLDHVRAALVARSGLQAALSSVLDQPNVSHFPTLNGAVGGSHVVNGDSFTVDYGPASGRIDLNDGIRAGRLEEAMAPTLVYNPRAIDPWPLGGIDESALINLRLRRLLNAYGDAHKYFAEVFNGDPALPAALGIPFVFTSTCSGANGQSLPARDLAGANLILPVDIIASSTGLGDRLIAARPDFGYIDMSVVRGILNTWGTQFLPASYLAGIPFSEMAINDLTTNGDVDMAMSRWTREFGSWHADSYMRTDVVPQYLDSDPPDFTGLWRPHAASVINLNAASPLVRAALYYAPVNVSYVTEANQTIVPAANISSTSTGTPNFVNRMAKYGMARPNIGVGGVVFREDRLTENGYPSNPVANPSPPNVQRHRFMSLHDAFFLAEATSQWQTANGDLRDFEDFKAMLEWKRLSGVFPDYERAQASGVIYDPTFKTVLPSTALAPDAGAFTQNYVEETLPHVLSPYRRVPGWLGAPAALLSPLTYLEPEIDSLFLFGMPIQLLSGPNGHGHYPDRKVEDFCWRFPLPKLVFQTQGVFHFESMGSVDTIVDTVKARVVADVELFATESLRTQQDFEALTDSSTDAAIVIGPEFTTREGGTTPGDAYLGVVGLRDRVDAPLAGNMPQLVLNFSKDALPDAASAGVANVPAAETLISPSLVKVSPFADEMANSPVEDINQSFFATGSAATDISPFGGLRCQSLGHGLYATDAGGAAKSFQDSLYWRLDDATNPLVDPAFPIGNTMRKGFITFWVRIPSGHDSATPLHYNFTDNNGSKNIEANNIDQLYHNFVHLNFWQRAPFQITSLISKNLHIPMGIEIGYTVDPITKERKLVSKISQSAANVYTYTDFTTRDIELRYRGVKPLVTIPHNAALTAQNDLCRIPPMLAPGSTVQQSYKEWFSHKMSRYITREIVLKDVPEAGPGTWHRVSVGWDITYNYQSGRTAAEIEDMLWMRLRDESNVKSYNVFYSQSKDSAQTGGAPANTIVNGAYRNHVPGFNGMNTLSVGEVHMRFRGDYDPVLSSAQTTPKKVKDFFPAWRAETMIDNLRVTLGDVPASYNGQLSAAFDAEPQKSSRYNLQARPEWVLAPALPQNSMLYSVDARVYFPEDSNGNVSAINLDVRDVTGASFTPVVSAARGVGHTYFDKVDPSTKIAIEWTDWRRDGSGPLALNSTLGGGDDVTAIPWLVDVSYRYRTAGHFRVLHWDID